MFFWGIYKLIICYLIQTTCLILPSISHLYEANQQHQQEKNVLVHEELYIPIELSKGFHNIMVSLIIQDSACTRVSL